MSRHKKWLAMDRYKRKLFLKYFIKKLLLKSIKNTLTSTNSRRYLAYFYIVRVPNISSQNSFSKRCIKSGRVWSTNNKVSLSRFELRQSVYKSNLPGFRRASW